VVDFTSISAHIATSNALGGDWEAVEEKLMVEFVFCKNAELLLPKVTNGSTVALWYHGTRITTIRTIRDQIWIAIPLSVENG